MDDKQQPEAKQEEGQKTDQAQAGQAPAAASPEEMNAELQAALAQMPRDEQGALVDPKTGERLADGVYAVSTPDGQEMQFEVKNNPAARAEQAQAAQPEAGMAEQPGLADLPAPEMPEADKADVRDSSPEAKTEVLEAMGAAVGARILASSGFDVPAEGVDGDLIKAVDRLARGNVANATAADFAPDANAPKEPSHAARQAGEVVGKHTEGLAKAAAAVGAGGPTR